jgi:hypothetical protein
MCNAAALMAGGAVMSAGGAFREATAQKASLLYDATVADNNAQISEWQAQDSVVRGQYDEQTSRVQTAMVKGAQRAAMAANGIDIGAGGSASDVLTSTDYIGERDALAIRNDALRSAWGYRTQRDNYLDNARNLRRGAKQINPMFSALTSLLGSASSVATSNYLLSKSTVGVPTGGK